MTIRLPRRDQCNPAVMQAVDLGEKGWVTIKTLSLPQNAANSGVPLGQGGQKPVIHDVGRAAPVSDFSAVYHGTRPLGIIMVCSVQDPRQQKQAVVAKNNVSGPTLCYVPTGRQPPGSRKAYMQISIRKLSPLGTGSWPFAVDAADEGRTKLFLTADSAPRCGMLKGSAGLFSGSRPCSIGRRGASVSRRDSKGTMVKWDGRTVTCAAPQGLVCYGVAERCRIRLMLLVRSPSLGAGMGWDVRVSRRVACVVVVKGIGSEGHSFLDFSKMGAVAGTRNSACWCAEKGTLWVFGIFSGRRSDFRFGQIWLPG